jgi:hypothetical protein
MIDVKKLAEQAGLATAPNLANPSRYRYRSPGGQNVTAEDLADFASMVLEAAAVECEKLDSGRRITKDYMANQCADAIRALKPKERM